jgi:hypothetical protein
MNKVDVARMLADRIAQAFSKDVVQNIDMAAE